jgi:hypothetical protein
VSRFNNFVI